MAEGEGKVGEAMVTTGLPEELPLTTTTLLVTTTTPPALGLLVVLSGLGVGGWG